MTKGVKGDMGAEGDDFSTTRYNAFMSEVKPFRLTESVKAAG
jgi:hypothetical protein